MPATALHPAPAPVAAPPRTGVLIAGGDADPNITALLRRANERGLNVVDVRVGAGSNPGLTWDMQADTLLVEGEEIRPECGFLRHDVFTGLAEKRASAVFRANAWYTVLHGWMLAHDEFRVMNRDYAGQVNKPFMLRTAAECGLRIPRTLITNEVVALDEVPGADDMIAKPVPGGGYTQMVRDLRASTGLREGRSAAPAFVQERLIAPEVRIYGVGGRFIPFAVISEELDYRAADDTRVELLPVESIDPSLLVALGRLMKRLRMEFGAADFKTHAETGELVFMEINSSPMFVAFDRESDSAVSDAILDWLTPD